MAGGLAAAAVGSWMNSASASPPPGRGKYAVAIIGCGRIGQYYAEIYRAMPDTELVAIAEWNDERRPIVGKRFGVSALFKDVNAMLKSVVPDIAAIATPTKFMKEAVIACAEAGVKGISTEKPIAARLSDADEMVEACKKRNVVFAGGMLKRAKWEVQEVARRIRAGEFGAVQGAAVHSFGDEISGRGCQNLSILRLFTDAEAAEVMAWGFPPEALEMKDDSELSINGSFRMSSGVDCRVFSGGEPSFRGVDLWTDKALVRWNWDIPEIYLGRDAKGIRKKINPGYAPFPWDDFHRVTGWGSESNYLVSSIRSLVESMTTGGEPLISGYDLRQALEIAIACKLSAQLISQPVRLPLEDRSLALYPSKYRWLGGDSVSHSQSPGDAARSPRVP
jgi:predicted dehydrogenase